MHVRIQDIIETDYKDLFMTYGILTSDKDCDMKSVLIYASSVTSDVERSFCILKYTRIGVQSGKFSKSVVTDL